MSDVINYPGQPEQPQGEPPKKKHTVRNIVLGVVGALFALAIIRAFRPDEEPAASDTNAGGGIPEKVADSAEDAKERIDEKKSEAREAREERKAERKAKREAERKAAKKEARKERREEAAE